MTKDLFDKYIWLVDTIYRAGKITFEEINERWLRSRLSEGEDIPLRTFHNWRIAIEQVFDININCNRKGGYYYYIENADDMHHLKRRILFEEIPSGRKYLTPVIEAMRDGLEIELYYQSYWYEEPSTYTLQPYCIKVFRQRWYVIGFCKERNNIRIFSLDRIQQLTTLDTKFVYPKDFDPEAYFTDYFGIMIENKKLETIRIKVYGMYIRSLPLHHSQCEIKTTEDYSIFEYRMKPTLDFRQELFSRGADVEVLAHLSFREEMIQSVNKMSLLYNKQ